MNLTYLKLQNTTVMEYSMDDDYYKIIHEDMLPISMRGTVKFITTSKKVQEIKESVGKELLKTYKGLGKCMYAKDYCQAFSKDRILSETSPAEYYKAVEKWFEKIEEAKEIEFEKIKEKHRQNRLQSGNIKPE